MARSVYSVCFYQTHDSAGLASYDVPAGHTAVLKDMTFWVPLSTPPGLANMMEVSLDSTYQKVWSLAGSNIRPGAYHWSGSQVFTVGLYLWVTTATFAFRACGFLLTPT